MSKIRNIIFDLGGVLLNINPLLSLNELGKISRMDVSELKIRLEESGVFEKFDTGRYNPSQFRNELCRIIGQNVEDSELDRIWNSLLLDFPASRVKMVKELKENYSVFLLSNTNSIHYLHYTTSFFNTYQTRFEDLFDSLFLSFEMGMHKPDAGIYKHMLNTANLVPSECLFIDDLLPNVKAAFQQGIPGIHLSGEHDVTDYFKNGLLRPDVGLSFQ